MRQAMIRSRVLVLLLVAFTYASVGADDGAEKSQKTEKKKDNAAEGRKTTEEAMASLTPGQKLQLRVDALETLNSVIGTVAKKAKLRTELLDKYLKENGLAEAYLNASGKMPERAPRTADWTKKEAAREDVPLSFDDAFEIAIECELEDRMDEIRATEPNDVEGLEKALKAHKELAEKRFAETVPQMIAVDRKIDFLRDQGLFEKARVWASGELERQEVEKEQEKDEQRKADEAEKDRKQEEQLAKAEKARERRIEKNERRWQKQTEAYSLRTEREKAKMGTDYPRNWYYPNGRLR